MTGVVYDDVYLQHEAKEHPESPERLRACVEHLKKCGLWEKVLLVPPRKAPVEEIMRVHSWAYIRRVKEMSDTGGGFLDPDTYVTEKTFETASWAAGGVLSACDAVLTRKVSNALALVRPPGHHASASDGSGFCIFNNVAIAAKYLQAVYSIWRIAIIDWDVHHGNGTQSIFYADPTVFFLSAHRFPFFPGTGEAREVGTGPGTGFNKNVPLPAATTASDYVSRFSAALRDYVAPFSPEFILISAGFDAYSGDPIGGLNLWPEDFARLTEQVLDLARKTAGGRVVSVLEGGYDLMGLPACVEQHLTVLISPPASHHR